MDLFLEPEGSEEEVFMTAKEIARYMFGRTLIKSEYGKGILLHDQDKLVLTKEEWIDLKTKVDLFYAEIPEGMIEQHNKEIMEPYEEQARILALYDARRAERERKRQEIDNRPTSIYIMVDHRTGYYKIGKSSKPAQREKTLQADNPLIELLFSFSSTHGQEKQLHAQYADKRIRGEWFALTDLDVKSIKELHHE